jgi:hypothetical protein
MSTSRAAALRLCLALPILNGFDDFAIRQMFRMVEYSYKVFTQRVDGPYLLYKGYGQRIFDNVNYSALSHERGKQRTADF